MGNDYKMGARLGDYFLEPDPQGHIDAAIRVNKFRPYVGLGWGRAVPRHHAVGFSVDLGVQFWNTPKVYCQEKLQKPSGFLWRVSRQRNSDFCHCPKEEVLKIRNNYLYSFEI